MALAAVHARGATQPNAAAASDDTKNLIVMLKCKLGGEEEIGAGIIFGSGPNRLYVATANHLVREGRVQATNPRIMLRWLPDEWMNASLMDHFEPVPGLDLAVLSLDLDKNHVMPKLLFQKLGHTEELGRGDSVHTIGYPAGKAWKEYLSEEKFAGIVANNIGFESQVVAPGHSGGGLLNERYELVGMIIQSDPPDAKAVALKSVVEALKQWGYPVSLSMSAPTQKVAEAPPVTALRNRADSGSETALSSQTACQELLAMDFKGAAKLADDEDYRAISARLGIEPKVLRAVAKVETTGKAYLKDGRPGLLFERQIFHRLTSGRFDDGDISDPKAGGYGAGGEHQYDRLKAAAKLDCGAALQSASWGLFQILGSVHGMAGFNHVDDFVRAMIHSERDQLESFFDFLVTTHMDSYLRKKDWAAFARAYNGSSEVRNGYSKQLAAVYDELAEVEARKPHQPVGRPNPEGLKR